MSLAESPTSSRGDGGSLVSSTPSAARASEARFVSRELRREIRRWVAKIERLITDDGTAGAEISSLAHAYELVCARDAVRELAIASHWLREWSALNAAGNRLVVELLDGGEFGVSDD